MLLNLKKKLADSVAPLLEMEAKELVQFVEMPKVIDHGDLALPVFRWSKLHKKTPQILAEEWSQLFRERLSLFTEIQPVSGFINFKFKDSYLIDELKESLFAGKFLSEQKGRGKKLLIDYSSPNIAKSMHIGHFRATIVGQALRNLAKAHGYDVIGVNHIGDWGTQFGKLAWAIKTWGHEYDMDTNPMDALTKLYVRFHDEAEKNNEIEESGAKTFLLLEKGDPEITAIWKKIVELSFVEYNKIYSILDIKHDFVLGESFYNDKLNDVVEKLKSKNLLKESEGAQVVFFDESEKTPPCIIQKSDGASIYATRDLAAAIYRHEVQKADEILYVVGAEQSLHFKQVFKVLEMLGYSWSQSCHHISFGQYRFKEGKMSTRKGRVLLAEDLIRQAVELARELIEEKNPTLEKKDIVANQVGLGAIIFNDLLTDRVKNVDFEWERALNTEGDSGPFVQYTNVRCLSILRKAAVPFDKNYELFLSKNSERNLLLCLLSFETTLDASFRQYKPSVIAQYLLDVCAYFSTFYHECRIIGEEEKTMKSRLALVKATSDVLTYGLTLLNIPTPEQM